MTTDRAPTTAEAPAARLKHTRTTRWTHWINFPLLTIMIWSGLRIYWADVRDPYGFGIGLIGWHWFDFLPDAINERLGLERRLARGMAFHFTFGWLFVINGIAYALYTWRSGEWRHLLPNRRSFREAVTVVLHDLFIRRGQMPPQGRYNAAQRLSYTMIVAMGGLAVLTGLAIYKPTQVNPLTTLFGGYEMSRTIHFAVTIGFLVFFAVHMLQVARAGWSNFASMVTGYEPIGASSDGSGSGEAAPTLVDAAYRRQTRRSVLTGAAASLAAFVGWRWMQTGPEDNNIPVALRRGHEANEALWRRLSGRTAPTFDRSRSSMLRVNGRIGIGNEIDLDSWEMTVLGPDGSELGRHTIDDVMALPKVELTVEHKCVEGWSHIVTWGGARFSDFVELHRDRLPGGMTDYVALVTPDREYYVGLDRLSMLHPQMLLAYELEGEPLTQEHGAPLRLATPNKYGIKCLKRIGTIQFTDDQPTDYWYERGYDWYAQL